MCAAEHPSASGSAAYAFNHTISRGVLENYLSRAITMEGLLNGFLQMPGGRTLVSPLDQKRWYYANNPSTAVPDGSGDEAAIRSIWASDARAAATAGRRVGADPSTGN